MRFSSREHAGRLLAQQLLRFQGESPVVLGLPRGGVPVAFEVATALHAPLDVWVVRKVGAPDFPEFGVGAVAERGIVFLNTESLRDIGVTEEDLDEVIRQKATEVAQRARLFRRDRPAPPLADRTVILVDDGIATGGTVRAAVEALRTEHPRKIILAVPVAATQSLEKLEPLVDEVVCLHATPALYAIGAWYDDFEQVGDEAVVQLLERARASRGFEAHAPGP